MATPRVFRLIQPVDDLEIAVAFYARVLDVPGDRVNVNRHYFPCGGVVLACVEGPLELREPRPRHDPRIVYVSVPDIDDTFRRVREASPHRVDDAIETQPWGERSFYAEDPSGNPLCFVQEGTEFTGTR